MRVSKRDLPLRAPAHNSKLITASFDRINDSPTTSLSTSPPFSSQSKGEDPEAQTLLYTQGKKARKKGQTPSLLTHLRYLCAGKDKVAKRDVDHIKARTDGDGAIEPVVTGLGLEARRNPDVLKKK